MKMKKIASLFLALVMMLSFNALVFAEGEHTTVTYKGTGTEEYRITVPPTLAPGTSDNITVTGTWASNRKLTVTAPTSITLTNSLNSRETKNLAITFAGISQIGNNYSGISISQPIEIEDAEGILFGTWTGTITYTISMGDAN